MRLIRVMCSGRVDPEFVFRAFSKGLDGVFIGGCRLGECNYLTHGNYHALATSYLCKKIMEQIGLNPERLRIEFMSSGEGIRLAEVTNDFGRQVREIGPLGVSEGMGEKELQFKLESVRRLVPYLKLVERERLRVPEPSEDAYRAFYTGEEFTRLFDALIGDKLAVSQISLLLAEQPRSTAEISEMLNLNPSEVSRHMSSSSRQGLVRYDEGRKCYALA